MGNKDRSNNRGPFWPDPSDLLRFQRRSSAVGPGLYSRGQLAVVAIDMRAIDIWVHISQGWQVRALLLPLSYLPPLQRFLRCTTHNSFAGSQATQYAGARELCPPFVNHLDVSLIGRPLASTKRTGTGKGRVCKGKPLTCPLPFGDYIAGSRTNDARWSKSGRQIECLVWWSEIFL